MLEKLEAVGERFKELNTLLSDPAVVSDRENYKKYAKEHAELQPIVSCFEEYRKVSSELEGSKELLDSADDEELREMAQEEVHTLKAKKAELHETLMLLLVPKDPNDEKNTIIELRAGTGGDEAALFAEDLFNMFTRYAEKRGWTVEIMSSSESSVGGFKEVIARIAGKGAFSAFKYEKGVHRVQRVPATETQGRIHTSTVTVAILAEAEEVDIAIADKDLRIDVFRASGPGGQSVNTTDSAIRITHIPTGLVVTCQDEKSQLKNKNKAMTVLRSRLLEMEQEQQAAERAADRKGQIGTGERSEKIRTYNFPQGRITDHRIGLTVYQLENVLGGEMEALIEPLSAHFQAEALQASES